MAKLSHEAKTVLADFREHESPPARVVQRSWTELQDRLDLEATVDPLAADTMPASGSAGFYAKVVGLMLGIAAATLLSIKLVGLGVTALMSPSSTGGMEAPYEGGKRTSSAAVEGVDTTPVRRARTRRVTNVAPEPANEVEASAPPVAETESGPPLVQRPSHSPRPSKAHRSDRLAAEVALMTQAQQAGDPARALELLADYRRRFPQGVMQPQAAVLRAQSLCALGRVKKARRLAREFVRKHPRSALAAKMKRVCAGSP